MKKHIIVLLVNYKNKEKPMNIVSAPINCTENDEASIKYAIESQKNDSTILLNIMMYGVPEASLAEVQPFLNTVKKLVEECESIDVLFLDAAVIEKFKQARQRNSTLHEFSKN